SGSAEMRSGIIDSVNASLSRSCSSSFVISIGKDLQRPWAREKERYVRKLRLQLRGRGEAGIDVLAGYERNQLDRRLIPMQPAAHRRCLECLLCGGAKAIVDGRCLACGVERSEVRGAGAEVAPVGTLL